MVETRTVFSGMQPTGKPHLGNYLGAFRNWLTLQDSYETIYCVVDLHGMTAPYDPAEYRRARLETAKVFMAVGLDPERSLIYYQSEVPQHVELSWILSTLTPTGVLNRMTQYKDKLASGTPANLGLYSYPVLQAADILVLRADLVPVGEDQKQHVEATRDLAQRFNNRYGDVFPIPDALIPPTSARVMSLVDPTSKMSKSDPNERGTVNLLDSADEIRRKIKSAVTDSEPTVRYDVAAKPGISNLLEIMADSTGRSIDDLVEEYADGGYGAFKEAVAEAVVEVLAPVRRAYERLADEEVTLLMEKGAESARTRAEGYQREVRAAVGLS